MHNIQFYLWIQNQSHVFNCLLNSIWMYCHDLKFIIFSNGISVSFAFLFQLDVPSKFSDHIKNYHFLNHLNLNFYNNFEIFFLSKILLVFLSHITPFFSILMAVAQIHAFFVGHLNSCPIVPPEFNQSIFQIYSNISLYLSGLKSCFLWTNMFLLRYHLPMTCGH